MRHYTAALPAAERRLASGAWGRRPQAAAPLGGQRRLQTYGGGVLRSASVEGDRWFCNNLFGGSSILAEVTGERRRLLEEGLAPKAVAVGPIVQWERGAGERGHRASGRGCRASRAGGMAQPGSQICREANTDERGRQGKSCDRRRAFWA